MSTKINLLEIFTKNSSTYISGQELATKLGISRNSVWKAIKKLQDEGYNIESKPSVGYRLLSEADVLSSACIKDLINIPCKINAFHELTSTNDYAKTVDDLSVPNIIIANEQTKGRGRLGRSFYSPASKGIYFTIVFEPDFGLEKSMLVTTLSAVAICHAFEEVTGIGPKIKWVNDLYLNDKKVCGILTEAESNFETGRITRILVGIGINCFEQRFPEDIRDRATFIENPPKDFNRNELIAAVVNNFFSLLNNFDKKKLLRDYKSRSMILGQPIRIYGTSHGDLPENGGKGIKARAIDIDENGGLVVEYMEGPMSRQMETITSGEVTIRKENY